MKQEMAVEESPERVLVWVEEKLLREFPYRAQVNRPITTRNEVRAFTQRGLFPATAFGWVFNITLTLLTLGSWLLIYALWLAFAYGSFRKLVTVRAYPADEEGTSRITLEATPDSWGEVVHGWLAERYGEVSSRAPEQE